MNTIGEIAKAMAAHLRGIDPEDSLVALATLTASVCGAYANMTGAPKETALALTDGISAAAKVKIERHWVSATAAVKQGKH